MDSDYMVQVGDEIGMVKDNSRLLIIVSHAFLEMLVKTLTESHVPNVKFNNHFQRLERLKRIGVINDYQFNVYDWFRKLRNIAVHTPIFKLSESHFSSIVSVVDSRYLKPEKMHRFSISLISELWNNNLQVLGPQFLSKYY